MCYAFHKILSVEFNFDIRSRYIKIKLLKQRNLMYSFFFKPN